jgi:tRNA(fMet)-specific endonuclease VapC
MERLILDTGTVMAIERGQADRPGLPGEDADVAISAISVSELLVGVELAGDEHRERRHRIVEGTIERAEVIAFDLGVVRHHAALLAHTRWSGRPRPAHDLRIAATARASGRTLITTDAQAFDDLPGVTYRTLA